MSANGWLRYWPVLAQIGAILLAAGIAYGELHALHHTVQTAVHKLDRLNDKVIQTETRVDAHERQLSELQRGETP